jgi:hypothetical protein
VQGMDGYIPWCVRDGSQYFGLDSLCNGNVGFAGAAPELYALGP